MSSRTDVASENIELLVRAALLDDARNIGERFAVLLADVDIDEDGDAWVTLDSKLWPEDKVPLQAMVVAGILGIELDVEPGSSMPSRQWASLAKCDVSTMDYVSDLLAAKTNREPDLNLVKFAKLFLG